MLLTEAIQFLSTERDTAVEGCFTSGHLQIWPLKFTSLSWFDQKPPRPTGQSPSRLWRKMLLKRMKKAARMSGSKLAPETRLPSLDRPTLSAHPSLIFLVDTSGMLTDGSFFPKRIKLWLLNIFVSFFLRFFWLCSYSLKLLNTCVSILLLPLDFRKAARPDCAHVSPQQRDWEKNPSTFRKIEKSWTWVGINQLNMSCRQWRGFLKMVNYLFSVACTPTEPD